MSSKENAPWKSLWRKVFERGKRVSFCELLSLTISSWNEIFVMSQLSIILSHSYKFTHTHTLFFFENRHHSYLISHWKQLIHWKWKYLNTLFVCHLWAAEKEDEEEPNIRKCFTLVTFLAKSKVIYVIFRKTNDLKWKISNQI